jgi:protein-tyrosine phosphatase
MDVTDLRTDQKVFKTYFICLGNRCRSPFAEGTFRRLTEGLPVEVSSAGTLDAPGFESPMEIHQLAERAGLNLRSHRSRALQDVPLKDADLVIGFDLSHIAGAVVEGGAPREKTFRLGELVRLLDGVEPFPDLQGVDRARAMIEEANEVRRASKGFFPDEDVADPYRGPMKGYEKMATRITQLTEKLVQHLFGSR